MSTCPNNHSVKVPVSRCLKATFTSRRSKYCSSVSSPVGTLCVSKNFLMSVACSGFGEGSYSADHPDDSVVGEHLDHLIPFRLDELPCHRLVMMVVETSRNQKG